MRSNSSNSNEGDDEQTPISANGLVNPNGCNTDDFNMGGGAGGPGSSYSAGGGGGSQMGQSPLSVGTPT